MPKAPATAESAENPTLQQSFEQALADIEAKTTASESASEPEQEKAEPTSQEPASDTAKEKAVVEQEPEHIRWAKSIEGNLDGDQKLNVDKIVKQAFEINRQNQTVAQQIAQLSGILRHPKVEEVIRSLASDQPAKKITPEEEKSDEQILDEFVNERVTKALEGVLPQVSILKSRHITSECELVYNKLKDEFGKTDDDKGYVYDTVRDDVTKMIAEAAQQANVPLPQLIEYLVDSGNLYRTFANATKGILFPRYREQATKSKTQSIEDKKRLRTTSGNTGAAASTKKVGSFLDAIEAAEAANPEFKKLT